MKEPFVAFMKKEIEPDAVVITCGLPATNKTETMEVLATLTGHTILRTDLIRRRVLEGEDIFDHKVAANMNKRTRVYDVMFQMASELVARGKGVILDATFSTQTLRRRAAEVAARHHTTLVIQQTSCPEEYSLQKISRRTRDNYESNALTPEAYYNNKANFEPVDLDDIKVRHPDLRILHLTVDTAHDDKSEWYVIERMRR